MELDFDQLPIEKHPKPTTRPLYNPEINLQLNVTPEKKGHREPIQLRVEQRQDSSSKKENALNK